MSRLSTPQQAKALATRTYWDTFGEESMTYSLELKLIHLGKFIHNGGDIADVVQLYAESTDDESRLIEIQWSIFYYLEYMINAKESLLPYRYSPTALRIMRLDKDELLELLQKELLRCVIPDDMGNYDITGVSSPNDKNLDSIERRHWRENPDEPIGHYWDKTRFWDRRRSDLYLWRKGK